MNNTDEDTRRLLAAAALRVAHGTLGSAVAAHSNAYTDMEWTTVDNAMRLLREVLRSLGASK